jgi:hypothetical protein
LDDPFVRSGCWPILFCSYALPGTDDAKTADWSGKVTWFTFAGRWVSYQRQTSLILGVGFGGRKWLLTHGFSRASATSVANIESFITVALFSGMGLLLSLSVLILDQYR